MKRDGRHGLGKRGRNDRKEGKGGVQHLGEGGDAEATRRVEHGEQARLGREGSIRRWRTREREESQGAE